MSKEHTLNNNFENGKKMTKIMIIKNEIGIPFLNGTSFSSALFCKGRSMMSASCGDSKIVWLALKTAKFAEMTISFCKGLQ